MCDPLHKTDLSVQFEKEEYSGWDGEVIMLFFRSCIRSPCGKEYVPYPKRINLCRYPDCVIPVTQNATIEEHV